MYHFFEMLWIFTCTDCSSRPQILVCFLIHFKSTSITKCHVIWQILPQTLSYYTRSTRLILHYYGAFSFFFLSTWLFLCKNFGEFRGYSARIYARYGHTKLEWQQHCLFVAPLPLTQQINKFQTAGKPEAAPDISMAKRLWGRSVKLQGKYNECPKNARYAAATATNSHQHVLLYQLYIPNPLREFCIAILSSLKFVWPSSARRYTLSSLIPPW